ncbi:MAG: protealysin inhibitor emfourin [Nocardioidaceae bacterium]
MTVCHFVPPFLLEKLARGHADPDVCSCGERTLAIDAELRARRTSRPPGAPAEAAGPGADRWTVYTADHGTDLPGAKVRATGEPPSGDKAVDEANDGVQATLAFYREVLGRASYDGQGTEVVASVHYEKNYDNAFWDGQQLVFGDGDGKVFGRFTKPVDVLGHEFTHAVTQYTANLTYQGQPGALNESISDAFGSCLKQRLAGQSVTEADWLIGQGLFTPSVHGVALRSMAAPGTAYDDPTLGKDPQVASMADYVDTPDDNGGVHTNSGIPNRAFYLAATGIGGNSWEGAGPIWYAALTSGIGADTDFAGFAAATLKAASAVSAEAEQAVRSAWTTVGVLGSGAGGSGPSTGNGAAGSVAVRRTGGFAGVQKSASVDLADDPRAGEITALLERIDLRGLMASAPQPDRFVYTFHLRGEQVTLGEQDLTPDLARLAGLVLDD